MELPMPKISGSTIIKLVIACFIVGFALAFFHVDPKDVLTHGLRWIKSLAEWSFQAFGSAISSDPGAPPRPFISSIPEVA